MSRDVAEDVIPVDPTAPLRFRYQYLTGEVELLIRQEPHVILADGIRIRVFNDSAVEEHLAVSIERTFDRIAAREDDVVLATHTDWGLGFTAPEQDFYWVRLHTSSPFVLPTVEFVRPTPEGFDPVQVFRPADLAAFQLTRVGVRIVRERLW